MVERLAASLLLLAACAAPPAPDPWTLSTIDTLSAQGDPAVTPANGLLHWLSAPFPRHGSGLQGTTPGLTVFPAFAEGKPAAYMTTEIWENFDEVWVQPLYVSNDPGQPPVFGVDQTSRFYSPFWQILTYTPPPGSDELESAQDILDSGAALTPNSGKFCALTQSTSVGEAVQSSDSGPVRPLNFEPVGRPRNSLGYANDRQTWFIDLGNQQRFTWNPGTLVVDETPLYAFALPDGTLLELPKVGGTGAPHAPRCDGHGKCAGVSPDGVPEFGALWRFYTILLPPGADVYVTPGDDALRAHVQAMGLPGVTPSTDLGPDYLLRVAVDGQTCFATDVTTCHWLDSQNAIEASLPDWRIQKTGTLAACPLTLFNGKALGL